MATMSKRKIYLLCCAITVTQMYVVWYMTFNNRELPTDTAIEALTTLSLEPKTMKYILQWTKPYTEPFKFMGIGQQTFIDRNCSMQNCYVTSDRFFLSNITDFDVILFHAPELYVENIKALPEQRSVHQKFVFVSMESSDYYPTCHTRYNNYFNWTWTYKLNSELFYGYMIIRDKNNEIVGPKEDMHWISIDEMDPIDEDLKKKLSTKRIAAAWFVSNCNAPSGRKDVAKKLEQELAKHNMTLDIYGECGTKKCPSKNMDDCLQMVERDYYFYLSFENSFSEDYVTEKLLHALKHFSVPVVYGGANYTRFMPEGIYLDVRKLGVKQVVSKMIELINNEDKYYSYFKWRNHYSYHYVEEAPETDYYCTLCSKVNDDKLLAEISYIDNLQKWWNPVKLRHNVCLKKT